MREIFMCLSHIEVEGGIKALDSLVVYRVCAIKRLLIPAKNFLRAFLVPGNVMSRYAGVVVVFALFPCLQEEPTCLLRLTFHFGLHAIGTELDDRVVRIHIRSIGSRVQNQNQQDREEITALEIGRTTTGEVRRMMASAHSPYTNNVTPALTPRTLKMTTTTFRIGHKC